MFTSKNENNLCYLNSVVQVLFSIKAFRKYIKKYKRNKEKSMIHGVFGDIYKKISLTEFVNLDSKLLFELFKSAGFMKNYILNEKADTQVLLETFLDVLICESKQMQIKNGIYRTGVNLGIDEDSIEANIGLVKCKVAPVCGANELQGSFETNFDHSCCNFREKNRRIRSSVLTEQAKETNIAKRESTSCFAWNLAVKIMERAEDTSAGNRENTGCHTLKQTANLTEQTANEKCSSSVSVFCNAREDPIDLRKKSSKEKSSDIYSKTCKYWNDGVELTKIDVSNGWEAISLTSVNELRDKTSKPEEDTESKYAENKKNTNEMREITYSQKSHNTIATALCVNTADHRNPEGKTPKQKRIGCYDKLKSKFLLSYSVRYTLKCGHTRKIEKSKCIFILRVNKKESLQKCIFDLRKPAKSEGKMVLCHTCLYKKVVKARTYKFKKLPKCLLLEVERGYKKNNQVLFYDKQVKLSSRVKINNHIYSVNSAILYKKQHYTTIVRKNGQFYMIDNSNHKALTILEALKDIEVYGRLIVLTRIKPKHV